MNNFSFNTDDRPNKAEKTNWDFQYKPYKPDSPKSDKPVTNSTEQLSIAMKLYYSGDLNKCILTLEDSIITYGYDFESVIFLINLYQADNSRKK
ncbi:MAG: hypothetical protein QM758_21180 [Armatimonas sp.]